MGGTPDDHQVVAQAQQVRRSRPYRLRMTVVTVVVVVAAVVLWRFFGDALGDRSKQAAATLSRRQCERRWPYSPIRRSPIRSASRPRRSANRRNPVSDKCLTIQVKAADSDAVVGGLIGTWPGDLGDKPALWIPGSSVSVARLQTAVDPRPSARANPW